MTGSPTRLGRAWLIMMATVLLAFALALAAGAGLKPRLAMSMVFAIVASLGLTAHALRTKALDGRSGSLAALTLAGWPITFAVGADIALRVSLRGPDGVHPGVIVALLVPFLGPILAPWLVDKDRAIVRVLRVVGPLVFAAGVALVAIGFASAKKPDPDTYLSRLPLVVTMSPGEKARVGNRSVSLMDVGTTRTFTYECALFDADGGVVARNLVCAPTAVYRDEANDLWLLRSSRTTMLRGPDLVPGEFRVRDIAKTVGPPVGWVHGATAVLVVAAIAFAGSLRLRRHARSLLAPGAKPKGTGYREDAGPPRADPALEADLALYEARADGAVIAAFVIVALAIAPLAVAVASGLGR